MERPKLNDYKPKKVIDDIDYAVWFENYSKALGAYLDELEKTITVTRCSELLPNFEDVKNRLDEQFFKDYETFNSSKKFYYKRGWYMCYSWIDKIVRGKAIV